MITEDATHAGPTIEAADTAQARTVVQSLAEGLRAAPPPPVSRSQVESFFRRQHAALVQMVATALARKRERDADSSPDLSGARERAEANLAAMKVLARLRVGGETGSSQASTRDRKALAKYSGWGGLSLERYQSRFPKGLRIDPRALIDEFYTPTEVAREVGRLIQVLMPTLPRVEGALRALEPSAGIGRFIREAPAGLSWSAAEYSEISAQILGALRPDVDLHIGPFEERAPGTWSLVVTNPPYGERGAHRMTDRAFKHLKRAQHYFLHRGLYELAPGGVGVFLVPRGFMDGTGRQLMKMRAELLKRHHLLDAWRLPSDIFPGAKVVTDLVLFRSRGGALPQLDTADQTIADGQWFQLHPDRILGEEIRGRGRFGYEVRGEFTGLGLQDWAPRPQCSSAACVSPAKPSRSHRKSAEPIDPDSPAGLAVALGERVNAYLRLLADPSTTAKAAQLQPALLEAVQAWISEYGSLSRSKHLSGHAQHPAIAALRSVVRSKTVLPALAQAPAVEADQLSGFSPSEIASRLYAKHGRLDIHLLGGHGVSRKVVWKELAGNGWRVDVGGSEQAFGSEVVPEAVYFSGDLWAKFDRCEQAIKTLSSGARLLLAESQKAELEARIGAVTVADIGELAPRASWLPLEVVTRWGQDALGLARADSFLREDGLLRLESTPYVSLRNTKDDRQSTGLPEKLLSFLGWANHDLQLFKPPTAKRPDGTREPLDSARLRRAGAWMRHFSAWLDANPAEAELVEHAYNRAFRGWGGFPTFASTWEAPARWKQITPHSYQAETINRAVAQGRMLLAFDVGLGKTFTLLAILAAQKQRGLARRPVIAVPNSLAFKWTRDIAKVLPDFKVVVIGAKLVQTRRRKGESGPGIRAKTDTAAERGRKWAAFRAGLYDVAIVTYSVLPRTRMSEQGVTELVAQMEQVKRAVSLRQRELQAQKERADKPGAKVKKLTERQEAILKEGVAGFVAEKLALPKGQDFDAGVTWDELGIDWIGVDESQNFKNLFLIEPREGGVPDYMGNPGEGAQRAWALLFRTAMVRKRTGGGGVYLLSATPAKNSPLELYNALLYVAPDLLQRAGLSSSEHFVDRFCRLESREIEDVTGKLKVRQACVAFQNLGELRDLLFQVAVYKTAKDVGLKLPEPRQHLISVQPDPQTAAALDDTIAEIEDLDDRRTKLLQQGAMKTNPGLLNALGLQILGLKQRLSMLGLHPELPSPVSEDEGRRLRSGRPDRDKRVLEVAQRAPGLGKIGEVVRRVMQRRDCGHIVFVDYLAAHIWLREALVQAGMPRDRIAILNAPMVPDTNKRQQIAEDFNGAGEPGSEDHREPKYDVVIANAVAYEGVDLQRRTCAIHHVDMPWEPATVRQRNGRGVRQGNQLGEVDLYYYLGLGTPDRMRLDKVRGKAAWMEDLQDASISETSNPAAMLDDDGWDEFRIAHSRDPDKARARLEQRRSVQKELARARREKGLRSSLKAAATLFARARSLETRLPRPEGAGEEASKLRSQAEQRLGEVTSAPPSDFPWQPVAHMARTAAMVVPTEPGEAIVHEELCLRPEGGSVLRFGKLGKDDAGKPALGWVRGDDVAWNAASLASISNFAQGATPEQRVDCPPPELEDRKRAAAWAIGRNRLSGLRLRLADEQWLAWWWPAIEDAIKTGSRWYGDLDLQIPARTSAGTVLIKPQRQADLAPLQAAYLYPPTAAGWEAWLQALPTSGLTWTDAHRASVRWWGRSVPHGLIPRSAS